MKKIFILIIISTLIFGTLTSCGKVDTQKILKIARKLLHRTQLPPKIRLFSMRKSVIHYRF